MSKEKKKTKSKKSEEKAKTTKKKKATKTTKETKEKAKAKKETKPKAKKETKETKESKPTKEKTPTKTKKPTKSKAENTIFVGTKSAMVYVMAVMTCFNENDAKEVKICARGRAISVAVDVAELTRNRFIQDLKVKKITTSTEQVIRREGGGEANVSAIEIILSK